MLNRDQLLEALPLAGALPFVFGAILIALDIPVLPLLGAVQPLVLTYGLAILSFMAGVHWGQHLSGVTSVWNLLVSSNVSTVIAWLSYALLPATWFALILAMLFLALLAIDRQLVKAHVIEPSYFRTRARVTALAVLSLLVVAYCLM